MIILHAFATLYLSCPAVVKNVDYFERYLKFKKKLKFELFLQYFLIKWTN